METIGRSAIPAVLLFDLGGVLVGWDGPRGLLALSGGSLDPERARRFWLESPWARRFELGSCHPAEFAAGVVEELGLSCSAAEFLDAFASWDLGPLPGALQLLEELTPRFRVACLSNNNQLHWSHLCQAFDLGRRFERAYLSHEIGRFKPDAAAFQYVVDDLRVPARTILFLDDNPECIRGARAMGLEAEEAHGVEEVRAVLRARGIHSGA